VAMSTGGRGAKSQGAFSAKLALRSRLLSNINYYVSLKQKTKDDFYVFVNIDINTSAIIMKGTVKRVR